MIKDMPVVVIYEAHQRGFVIDVAKVHPTRVQARDGTMYGLPYQLVEWALTAITIDSTINGLCEFGILKGRWYAQWLEPL